MPGPSKENLEYFKRKSFIAKHATLKECVLSAHEDTCSDEIINAHSLQRMGVLSILESEVNGNQCVYATTEKQRSADGISLELRPIGKKVASTFFGFCKDHDGALFRPIEENTEVLSIDSDSHCFLLSFRAFALSYHRKKEDVNLLKSEDQKVIEQIKIHYRNNDLKTQLVMSELGLNDLKYYYDKLVEYLFNEDYSEVDFFAYEVPHTVPFAVSSLTSPPFLFNGKEMNVSGDPEFKYSDIMTSVIPLKSRSLVVLAALKSDPLGSVYLNQLNDMPSIPLEKSLTWHVLTNTENIFFSPKWFDNLNQKDQQKILELNNYSADINTPYLKYDSKSFKINLFDSKHALVQNNQND